MSAVEIRAVTKHFGETVALSKINLEIPNGSYVVLLGPSGSGKTTLLSILGGFEQPTSGSVYIQGEDVTVVAPAKRPTATVFQDYALFPHMSVAGNIQFGLTMHGVARRERKAKADEMLELVGLSGLGNRRIHQLSGGQRQRVALARSLVVDPQVLLLDEPLGALDLNLRRQMQEELKAIQKRVGTTFIHVTHDQDEAMSIADQIVVLNNGQIEDVGPPSRVYLKPATRFTATFMGDNNLFDATIRTVDQESITIDTALGELIVPVVVVPTDENGRLPQSGQSITIAMRPEQVQVMPQSDNTQMLNLGEARLHEHTFVGTHHACRFVHQHSDAKILAWLPQRVEPRVGEIYPLAVAGSDVVGLVG